MESSNSKLKHLVIILGVIIVALLILFYALPAEAPEDGSEPIDTEPIEMSEEEKAAIAEAKATFDEIYESDYISNPEGWFTASEINEKFRIKSPLYRSDFETEKTMEEYSDSVMDWYGKKTRYSHYDYKQFLSDAYNDLYDRHELSVTVFPRNEHYTLENFIEKAVHDPASLASSEMTTIAGYDALHFVTRTDGSKLAITIKESGVIDDGSGTLRSSGFNTHVNGKPYHYYILNIGRDDAFGFVYYPEPIDPRMQTTYDQVLETLEYF